MTPTVFRRFGISLALFCGVAAVYCGLSSIAGMAQTPSPATDAVRKPASGKSPAATTPPASTLPGAGAEVSAPPSGKSWMDAGSGESDDHTGISTFRDWVYTRGDTVVTGSTARYNRKTDTLDTDDPVVMNDSKHHLTADMAHVEHAQHDPSLRFVVLTGHAVMVLKPETGSAQGEVPPAPVEAPGSLAPGKLKVVSISTQQPGAPPQAKSTDAAPPAEARKTDAKPPVVDKDREDANAQQRHGGTATCDKIEYKTAKKFATLTGHVVFKQRFLDNDGKRIERTLTCEHAENDGKANMLHLFKPVHFEDNDGQSGESKDDVLVGTKEGDETLKMVGHTHITLISPDDDEDIDDSKSTNQKNTNHTTNKGVNKTPQ